MTVFDAWTLVTELIELAKKLLQDLVQFCADFSFRFDIKYSSLQQCNGATANDDGKDNLTLSVNWSKTTTNFNDGLLKMQPMSVEKKMQKWAEEWQIHKVGALSPNAITANMSHLKWVIWGCTWKYTQVGQLLTSSLWFLQMSLAEQSYHMLICRLRYSEKTFTVMFMTNVFAALMFNI